MTKQEQPPSDPINIIIHDCDIEILGSRRTILKIDWLHIKKRNKEFQNSKKKKVRDNLDQYIY